MSIVVMPHTRITGDTTSPTKVIMEYLHKSHPGSVLFQGDQPVPDKVDIALIYCGPMAFCPFLEEASAIVTKARRIVAIQNDYTFPMPATKNPGPQSPFRKAFGQRQHEIDYWTNCPFNIRTNRSAYVNWNLLFHTPIPYKKWKEDALLYYGSYRQDRESSFKAYFRPGSVRQVIATPTRTFKKFSELAPHLQRVDPLFPLVDGLQNYRASLYLEDDTTHRIFHSLANRFYEAVSAGQALFVDEKCQKTFQLAGVPLSPDWVVRDAGDIQQRWSKVDSIALAQRKAWGAIPYREELDGMLRKAYTSLVKPTRLWIPRPRRIHYKD